jgi:hypothetical protein
MMKNNFNKNAKTWCVVNIDNEFTFMDKVFKINESLSKYKVFRKSTETKDFTNESLMDKIFVVVNDKYQLEFYDEDLEQINSELIHVLEK